MKFYSEIINEVEVNRFAITNVVSNFGEDYRWEWVQSEGLLEKIVDGVVRSTTEAKNLAVANQIAFRQAAEI